MPATTREDILGWVKERLEDVEQEGTLAIVGLLHFDGHGREQEIFSMKAGSGNWGNAEKMGESFYRFAERHAKGLIGQQQFSMIATYGSATKPTRFLPFGMSGMLQFGNVPGGGLSTEAPTEIGMRSQGMRMGEIVVQMMLSQIQPTFAVQANLIDRLMRRLAELEAENRELFVALRQELQRTVDLAHEKRLKELEFLRTTEERRRLIKIMPALANAMTGKEIFPTEVEDSALIETLCENVSEDEIKTFAALLGQKSPELSGLMMARFAAINKRKRDEMDELRRLATEAAGGSYEQAERDAMGQPVHVDAVTVEPKLMVEAKPEPAVTHVDAAAASAGGDMMLDTILAGLTESEVDQISGVLAFKRPDVPGLKDNIKQRWLALQKLQGGGAAP
jgi:hypothetical protein